MTSPFGNLERGPHGRRRHSHIFERDPNDWYLEPDWISKRLFDVEDFDRNAPLLDPCTGTGRIADAAKHAGYRVITADIVDRGYPGCLIQDSWSANRRRHRPSAIRHLVPSKTLHATPSRSARIRWRSCSPQPV
jgi:hypothetical protein